MTTTDLLSRVQMLWGLRNASEGLGDWVGDLEACDRAVDSVLAFLSAPLHLPTEYGYPQNWPTCPSCGLPALDGHITCGQVECAEGSWR